MKNWPSSRRWWGGINSTVYNEMGLTRAAHGTTRTSSSPVRWCTVNKPTIHIDNAWMMRAAAARARASVCQQTEWMQGNVNEGWWWWWRWRGWEGAATEPGCPWLPRTRSSPHTAAPRKTMSRIHCRGCAASPYGHYSAGWVWARGGGARPESSQMEG